MTGRFKAFLAAGATLAALGVASLSISTFATAAPDTSKLSLAADILKKAAILVKEAGPDRAGHSLKAMGDIEAAINEVKAAALGP